MKTAVVVAWLATELLKLPGSHAPGETKEEYNERVQGVAVALAEEATPLANGTGWTSTELAAAAGAIWYSESLFDRRIHAGEEHPMWHSDHGLAHCPMQLHQSKIVPPDIWAQLGGVDADATHLCARYGIRVVVAQARQCGVFLGVRADRARVAKTFASFASGGKCVPGDRDWKRADLWIRMMSSRPDHSKKELPGYRRVGPAEVPQDVRTAANGIVSQMSSDFPLLRPHVGDKFTPYSPTGAVLANYKLVVEKHAEGKIGVSVFVKE